MPGGWTFTWTSSDPDVAEVESMGQVTARLNGTTQITSVSGQLSGTTHIESKDYQSAPAIPGRTVPVHGGAVLDQQ